MTRRVSSVYNRNYFAANKAAIMAKRNLRRAGMTEAERETERQKACERAARSRAKNRELMGVVEELTSVLETLSSALTERGVSAS
jgi:ribosomal protein L9